MFPEIFWRDVVYGARMLWQKPAYSAVAVLTLALGIGANTAVFRVLRGVLLRPLPHRDDQQSMYLHQSAT